MKKTIIKNPAFRVLLILLVFAGIFAVQTYQDEQISSDLHGTRWIGGLNGSSPYYLFEFGESSVSILDNETEEVYSIGTYELLEGGDIFLSFSEQPRVLALSETCSGTYERVDETVVKLCLGEHIIILEKYIPPEKNENTIICGDLFIEDALQTISNILLMECGKQENIKLSNINMCFNMKDLVMDSATFDIVNIEEKEMLGVTLSQGKFTVSSLRNIYANFIESREILWTDISKILQCITINERMKNYPYLFIHLMNDEETSDFTGQEGLCFRYQDGELKPTEDIFGSRVVIEIIGYTESLDIEEHTEDGLESETQDNKYFIFYQ